MENTTVLDDSIETMMRADPHCTMPRGDRYKRATVHKYASAVIRRRENGECMGCGREGILMHHQNGDASDNRMSNLVWLCHNCHMRAHSKMRKFGEYRVTPGSEILVIPS